MDTSQLKDRIAKKEVQIEKILKRISKWENLKSEEAFCTDYAEWWTSSKKEAKQYNTFDKVKELLKANYPNENVDLRLNSSWESHIKECDNEIKWAKKDLEEAREQLAKYKSQLGENEIKASTEKIQVIVDFLNNWKDDARDYVHNNVEWLNKYYEADKKAAEFYNTGRWKYDDRTEANKIYKKMRDEANELSQYVHPWTHESRMRLDDGTYSIDDNKLNPILDKEAEVKYWELVARIKKAAGDIVDASGLHIGPKGNIEGNVVGTNNKVRVETIIAGGQNAGRLVNVKRGPIAHYRTIVVPIK